MDTICNVMALTTEVLLLALSKKVRGDREHNIVCNFKGAEEDDEELDDDPEYLELEKFSQKHRTLALAWSPETSLNVFPKTVAFCSAASDHKLRLYNSDLAANSTLQELRGHTDYINAVAYDPYGEYVVSTSDDHTCRVWSLKELPGQCITNIRLLSPDNPLQWRRGLISYSLTGLRLLKTGRLELDPGMSVACHQSEEGKLLVGEKCGVLSLFNLVSGQAILSFDSNRSPLLSADWSSNTSLYAVAVVAGEIVLWDTTNPRLSQRATTRVSDSACNIINHSPCASRVDRQNAIHSHPFLTCVCYCSSSQLLQTPNYPSYIMSGWFRPYQFEPVSVSSRIGDSDNEQEENLQQTDEVALRVSHSSLMSSDRMKPGHPLETCSAHVEGSECVRFSPLNHSYIATIGQPKHQLKITHLASPHPILVTNLQLTGGLTWHYRLPYVCVGNDRKLCMWKIATK
uniref:Uncharacterized protein n=1 Tax=Timema shepardi TaxID=629360 RepID=A0A7R9G1J7_TIMSH|nr:unnamed protein product [Timema shepardi]